MLAVLALVIVELTQFSHNAADGSHAGCYGNTTAQIRLQHGRCVAAG